MTEYFHYAGYEPEANCWWNNVQADIYGNLMQYLMSGPENHTGQFKLLMADVFTLYGIFARPTYLTGVFTIVGKRCCKVVAFSYF